VTRTGHAYTPKETKAYETLVQSLFISTHGKPILEGEIHATIKAYYGLVKADYVKNGNFSKQGYRKLTGAVRPTKSPDVDNLAKAILDSLNKIAYNDDAQVVYLEVSKHYAVEPRVDIALFTLSEKPEIEISLLTLEEEQPSWS